MAPPPKGVCCKGVPHFNVAIPRLTYMEWRLAYQISGFLLLQCMFTLVQHPHGMITQPNKTVTMHSQQCTHALSLYIHTSRSTALKARAVAINWLTFNWNRKCKKRTAIIICASLNST